MRRSTSHFNTVESAKLNMCCHISAWPLTSSSEAPVPDVNIDYVSSDNRKSLPDPESKFQKIGREDQLKSQIPSSPMAIFCSFRSLAAVSHFFFTIYRNAVVSQNPSSLLSPSHLRFWSPSVSWRPPDGGSFKFNTDANIDPSDGRVGIGIIGRDLMGNVLASRLPVHRPYMLASRPKLRKPWPSVGDTTRKKRFYDGEKLSQQTIYDV
ncbi:hypothetical protein QYF36_024093 [Acer negundo]|nr:hypothetical protein QYF36_024093 [Acer negundo]